MTIKYIVEINTSVKYRFQNGLLLVDSKPNVYIDNKRYNIM